MAAGSAGARSGLGHVHVVRARTQPRDMAADTVSVTVLVAVAGTISVTDLAEMNRPRRIGGGEPNRLGDQPMR